MNRRVLMGCYEVPLYGGASSVSYRMIPQLRAVGLPLTFANLILQSDHEYFRIVLGETAGNPDGFPAVHNCELGSPLFGPQPAVRELIQEADPDLMIGYGWIAARILRSADPERPVIYITSGSNEMKKLLEDEIFEDYLSFEHYVETRKARWRMMATAPDKEAVLDSDYIVTHSPTVKWLLEYFYPSHVGKMHDRILSIAPLIYEDTERFEEFRVPFEERPHDLLFVASDWSRVEKNLPLVEKVIEACPDLDIHVVGDIPRMQSNHASYHGFISSREDLARLMGSTKTCACPSRFDAAPGVLFEASALGCNVVASRNCGNWELCHPDLLVEQVSREGYVSRIRHSLTGPAADNRDRFLTHDTVTEWMRIIEFL